jgi:hypothetical protein
VSDLGEIWRKEFDDLVARTAARTQTDPNMWRTAGRPTKANPNGFGLDWWMESGVEQLEKYAAWLEATDWVFMEVDGEPVVEFSVEVEFGGIPVKGFIDAVMVTPAGEVVLIDYKTGARTPESHIQLGLYAASLERMGLPRPSVGAYYMTRKGEMSDPEPLGQFTQQLWDSLFSQFKKAVDSDIFIPNVSGHCRTCGVANACYAAGGTDAYIYDPMHPAYKPTQDTH